LADLRREYAEETPLRLHGRAAPEQGKDPAQWQDGDEGGIGVPFSAQMLRLLGHRDWYGSAFLAREAVLETSDWCHSRHPNHQRPGSSFSLCGWLLHLAVRMGQEPKDIVWLEAMPLYSVESLLRHAVDHADRWMHEARHRATRIQYDGDHGATVYCPQCAA